MKSKSKKTFIIDNLIDSNKKISKVVKETNKKNIKSVSLVINYEENKKDPQKKIIKIKKNNTKKAIADDKKKTNLKKSAKKTTQKKYKKLRFPLVKINNYQSEAKKEEIKIDSKASKIENNKDKDKDINITKVNEKIIDNNKTIAEIIEEAKKRNAKSISIFIKYNQKEKKAKIKKDKKAEQKDDINLEEKKQNINQQQNDSISKDQKNPKIEEENIEIEDLNTEELRILRIKRSKYLKISHPSKSSKKNDK
ncbi:MAG: hypothetical protein HPPSJP_2210 [Candidatus Hepatoplasma scabrum]|nr:MAG: hypothetical protein HPPSJP_2210 [Candidatus Hepatoplasma sp.]